MAEIKSTLEKVMERAASMGRASQEEIQSEERVKEGMRMAADYLQGKEVDFSGILEATGVSALVKKGLVQVFLRNITLPRDDEGQRAEKAMQGYAVDEAVALYEELLNLMPAEESETLRYRVWLAAGRRCRDTARRCW